MSSAMARRRGRMVGVAETQARISSSRIFHVEDNGICDLDASRSALRARHF